MFSCVIRRTLFAYSLILVLTATPLPAADTSPRTTKDGGWVENLFTERDLPRPDNAVVSGDVVITIRKKGLPSNPAGMPKPLRQSPVTVREAVEPSPEEKLAAAHARHRERAALIAWFCQQIKDSPFTTNLPQTDGSLKTVSAETNHQLICNTLTQATTPETYTTAAIELKRFYTWFSQTLIDTGINEKKAIAARKLSLNWAKKKYCCASFMDEMLTLIKRLHNRFATLFSVDTAKGKVLLQSNLKSYIHRMAASGTAEELSINTQYLAKFYENLANEYIAQNPTDGTWVPKATQVAFSYALSIHQPILSTCHHT